MLLSVGLMPCWTASTVVFMKLVWALVTWSDVDVVPFQSLLFYHSVEGGVDFIRVHPVLLSRSLVRMCRTCYRAALCEC